MKRWQSLAVLVLVLVASCGGPQVLTTGQRATAEKAGEQTAIAQGTCPSEDGCADE